MGADTLRGWCKQAAIDAGERSTITTSQPQRMRALEAEVRELKRANEILLPAFSFLAGARPATAAVVQFINDHRDPFGVELICRVLTEHAVNITPFAYYASSGNRCSGALGYLPIGEVSRNQPIRLGRVTARVLHVSESYGGGVLAAIRDYMRATPEVDHHLLYAVHKDAPIGPDALSGFASATVLPAGHAAAITATRAHARALEPDIVHAHSSFAGAHVRIALRAAGRSTTRPRLVYTPHCYAFERRDLGGAARFMYRMIELALSWNTDMFAACSPREATLSRWPLSRARTVYVPNVAPISRRDIDASAYGDKQRLTVVGAGRIRPGATTQKDPLWFLAAVNAARATGLDIDARWIGGGDPTIEALLRGAGIHITGWLPRDQVLDALAAADIYLHAGAWEGFPIAVLEADAFGVAQIVRTIPAFDGLGVPLSAESPRDVAGLLSALASGEARADAAARMRGALAANTPESQRAAIMETWGF